MSKYGRIYSNPNRTAHLLKDNVNLLGEAGGTYSFVFLIIPNHSKTGHNGDKSPSHNSEEFYRPRRPVFSTEMDVGLIFNTDSIQTCAKR